jgi:hypothetical protein
LFEPFRCNKAAYITTTNDEDRLHVLLVGLIK